jgi:uncharacterized protein YndB with AHSA1/START domain
MTEPMILRARVGAPRAAVHRALTNAGALRTWLAEHAEVDLPHRWVFWGRYTPEGDVPHQRLLYVDEHTLRFGWLLDGEETTTEVRLTAGDDHTTVITVSQTHFDLQEALAGTTIRGVLQTFWCLSIANLIDYLEGRELTPMCDFTSETLRTELTIGAGRRAVYESLIDAEQVTRWFGVPMEIEPRVGGAWSMVDHGGAKIVDLVQDTRVSLDWGEDFGVQTWELAESGGRTKLTFVCSGFKGKPPYAGWMGTLSGFAELRRFHEISTWEPIWLSTPASERLS